MSRSLSVHQEHELLLALEKAGIEADEAQAVITSKRNELAKGMLGWLREQLAPPTPRTFETPEDMLARFSYYAGLHSWPVEDLLDQLRDTMPADHVSSLESLLVLDIWLGDLLTTYEALAGWIEYEQAQIGNGFWRWDKELHGKTLSGPKNLRLLNPERYGDQPSVRWVELDMTDNRDSRPMDVRDQSSAGLQVLSAFAGHPNYPPAIDYDAIPGAWAAGLQVTVPGGEAWTHVPILHWYRSYRWVELRARWGDNRYWHYAVPVVREL